MDLFHFILYTCTADSIQTESLLVNFRNHLLLRSVLFIAQDGRKTTKMCVYMTSKSTDNNIMHDYRSKSKAQFNFINSKNEYTRSRNRDRKNHVLCRICRIDKKKHDDDDDFFVCDANENCANFMLRCNVMKATGNGNNIRNKKFEGKVGANKTGIKMGIAD